jgi:hypothetical protein
MRQSAKRVEQDLGSTPWRSPGGDIEHQLIGDPAEASVDLGFVREVFLEHADTQSREGSLEYAELAGEVHGG